MKCTDIISRPPLPSLLQVVGGLDIHKKMVVDVWRDRTGPSLNTLFSLLHFWESAPDVPLTLSLSLSLFQWKYFSEWCLCSPSVLPEPCDACHPKCYRAWDSSVHVLGYFRTVREVTSLSITERFSVVEKEERRVCVCVCACVHCFFFFKGGFFCIYFGPVFFKDDLGLQGICVCERYIWLDFSATRFKHEVPIRTYTWDYLTIAEY